ncbi:MAG: hypothetical protein HQK54_06950 [Oligoflexales bacterium]|nr:hypothetical protein [Oligoflexales bacterium]
MDILNIRSVFAPRKIKNRFDIIPDYGRLSRHWRHKFKFFKLFLKFLAGFGGLKEKILAAHRGNIRKVIIPKENEKDLRDISRKIMNKISIVPVEHMDLVLMHAFVWNNPKEDKKQDELFEKLREITATEIDTAGLSFQH